MLLPLSWLEDYIRLKDSPQKLAERLTLAGIEVESISRPGDGLSGVVVGQILKIEKHPSADKLQVTEVSIGKGQPLRIVCGATNIAVGQKVPVALVGTTLPHGLTLERRPIRGIVSEGMLCAEDELGLGSDHSGIIVLDSGARVGSPCAKALGLDETVLDLSISPQRTDLFSIYGIAREIVALGATSGSLHTQKTPALPSRGSTKLRVHIESSALCAQYIAVEISGIRPAATPAWMLSRLSAAGIRPTNAIVDITNYVMLELGQPLHAFDLEKIRSITGKAVTQIDVRTAKRGERMRTLDGKDRTLDHSMLVITSDSKPITLAGVMGGEATEVSSTTTTVLLEAAIFSPVSVRKTSQQLSLRSEASSRFEKGIPSYLPAVAAARAVQLLTQIAGARVEGVVRKVGKAGVTPRKIVFPIDFINDFLGTRLSSSVIARYMKRVGCEVRKSARTFSIRPPMWRLDLTIREDLAEEVGRLHGYNRLIPTRFTSEARPASVSSDLTWEDTIKDVLVRLGVSETLSYSAYGEQAITAFGLTQDDHFTIANPLDPQQKYLRQTLIPGILEAAKKNIADRERVDFFEVGTVFHGSKASLPLESRTVALISAGKSGSLHRLQGLVMAFLDAIGVDKLNAVRLVQIKRTGVYSGAELHSSRAVVGTIAECDERLLRAYKLRGRAAYAEFSVSTLASLADRRTAYKQFSIYPEVRRDLSLIFPDPTVSYDDIAQAITSADPLIVRVRGFDMFSLHGKKSISVRITFQSAERTLTATEVDTIITRITTALEKRFGARTRSTPQAAKH